jgi:competence protein ComEA
VNSVIAVTEFTFSEAFFLQTASSFQYHFFYVMLRHVYRRFKTHFELDRRQARIHVVLLWLTMLVLCSPVFTYYTYPLLLAQEEHRLRIDTSFRDHEPAPLPEYKEQQVAFQKPIPAFTEQDWIKVGLPAALAKRIVKYQSTGARLNTLQDLSKIYGMHQEQLETIRPFVLEQKQTSSNQAHAPIKAKAAEVIAPFDINQADTTSLMALPGIGPAYARRIIQYRTLLKGYVSTSQFKEVYGLSEFALEILEKYTFVTPQALASLKDCTYNTLNEHLYLSSQDARYVMQEMKKNTLCWDDLKTGLSTKAQEHLQHLKLYYPCP